MKFYVIRKKRKAREGAIALLFLSFAIIWGLMFTKPELSNEKKPFVCLIAIATLACSFGAFKTYRFWSAVVDREHLERSYSRTSWLESTP